MLLPFVLWALACPVGPAVQCDARPVTHYATWNECQAAKTAFKDAHRDTGFGVCADTRHIHDEPAELQDEDAGRAT